MKVYNSAHRRKRPISRKRKKYSIIGGDHSENHNLDWKELKDRVKKAAQEKKLKIRQFMNERKITELTTQEEVDEYTSLNKELSQTQKDLWNLFYFEYNWHKILSKMKENQLKINNLIDDKMKLSDFDHENLAELDLLFHENGETVQKLERILSYYQ